MKAGGLRDVVEKIEKLVEKLPGPLQNAILNEIRSLRELFLDQRPPRILLAGDASMAESALVRGLFGRVVAGDDAALAVKPALPGWFEFRRAGRGRLQVLDVRDLSQNDSNALRKTLEEEPPDAVLFLLGSRSTPDVVAGQLEYLEAIIGFVERKTQRRLGITALAIPEQPDVSLEDLKWHAQASMFSRVAIADRVTVSEAVFLRTLMEASSGEGTPAGLEPLLTAVADSLPNAAKLEIARITGLKQLQSRLAQLLIRSATAVCGAVGAQPIPLADLPILTSLQVAMVSGIIYISGRELNGKVALEFVGALGANVGLGMVLREGTRAAVKLIPGWGNAISGMVAAAGTYAIGKAATAYFIESVPIELAKKLFRKRAKKLGKRALEIEDKKQPPE